MQKQSFLADFDAAVAEIRDGVPERVSQASVDAARAWAQAYDSANDARGPSPYERQEVLSALITLLAAFDVAVSVRQPAAA